MPSELNIDIIGAPSLRRGSSSISSDDEETSSCSSSEHNKSDGRHESSCWMIRIPPLFVILTILLFSSLAFVVGTICRIVVLRDSMVHMANNKIMADDNMGVVPHPVVHDHPTGQHLLLDIKHIDSSFLNSEERLVSAMVELVASAADNTLLSYHCHQQLPMGVSCAGKICMYSISFIPMIPTLTNNQITQTLLYSTWDDTGVLLEGHVS